MSQRLFDAAVVAAVLIIWFGVDVWLTWLDRWFTDRRDGRSVDRFGTAQKAIRR